jgi:hypothetical protein
LNPTTAGVNITAPSIATFACSFLHRLTMGDVSGGLSELHYIYAMHSQQRLTDNIQKSSYMTRNVGWIWYGFQISTPECISAHNTGMRIMLLQSLTSVVMELYLSE